MYYDIFANFDEHNKIYYDNLRISLWISPLILSVRFYIVYMVINSPYLVWTKLIAKIINEQISQTERKNIGGTLPALLSIAIIIVIINFIGLVPYIFRTSRHLSVNFLIALPLWLRIILIRISFDSTKFLAHFQPIGAPSALNPFLCIIELVSALVRPLTLTVRLTANIRTGHILLRLLGLSFSRVSLIGSLILVIIGTLYLIFEIGVSIVQAYIFTILPTIYIDEHPKN